MPEKKLPAIADRPVWEKTTKGRAGIRWDNVVEKIWKGLGDHEEVLSIEKFGGYKTQVNYWMEERERLALRSNMTEEKHFEMHGRLREDMGMEMYLHGQWTTRKSETAFWCRGPGPARKKKIYQQSGGGGRGCTYVPV